MDNITHGIIGGWIMDAVLWKSEVHTNAWFWKRNKIMIVGWLIANIPDIDIFINQIIPWSKPIDQFLFHRGYTHTILFAFIISLLVGRRWAKKDKEWRPLWRWMLASFITICVGHLFVDLMTSYGIRLLLPFTDRTFSLNNIFVIDFFYTLPLILLWFIYVLLRKQRARHIIKLFSWAWILLYALTTFVTQYYVADVFTDSLDKQQITHSRIFVTPEPLQTFLWHGVVQSWPGYYDGYYSLFDTKKDIRWRYIPNNTLIRKQVINASDVRKVEWFAQWWTTYGSNGGTVTVEVVKMGSILGRERPVTGNSAQFAFRINASGDVLWQEGMWRFLWTSFSNVWHEHWKRVWGKE